MDNASHALLIAGGILLGILTLTLFVAMFSNLSVMQNAKAEKNEAKKLKEWNTTWEVYNKQYLYGSDVLTVINKALESNDYSVEIIVDGVTVVKDCQLINSAIRETLKGYMKTRIYTCVDIGRDENAGRVDKMSFALVE